MHLGVIPDGNRRYAQENSLEKEEAYREAKDVIVSISEEIENLPVEVAETTFYLLSEENLRRDEEELETLFNLLEELIEEVGSGFNVNGFSFNWATTNPEALPDRIREKLRELEERFSKGKKQLNVLISYSGKKDILQAAETIEGNGGDFTADNFQEHLEIETDIDYVLRTGDNPTRECVSGFPIWNSSYAEYCHIQKHFPEVDVEDIRDAMDHYKELRRKKGK